MKKANILVVEDDLDLREAIRDTLVLSGYDCLCVQDGESAMSALGESEVDLIVSDVNMPGMSGLSLLKALRNKSCDIPVLLMTAYGNIGDAVQAMRSGAIDYLLKPFEPQWLIDKIKQIIPAENSQSVLPIVEDPKSKQLLALAKRAASSNVSILISGESGTGKEVLARYIHDHSDRADYPFVAINCAAIPENMLEAILFGHEKGAFTGAQKATPGKFEQAQDGSLLLDEISEMDLNLQSKLLRVLQEKEVERIGSQKVISLNVRIIATTNRDLKQFVSEGNFREDLYYRLNVFPLHWEPLRERGKDILPLVEYLIGKYTEASDAAAPTLSEGAKAFCLQYSWPGNARELENAIQRALILCGDNIITEEDLKPDDMLKTNVMLAPIEQEEKLSSGLKKHESEIILTALKEFDGDRKKVAEHLGISPRTLRYKLAKLRDEGITIS